MGIFQRAFLSVIRKLGKSVVLFLVLLVVSTFVLVGLSTKRTSDTAALELRHTLGGNFGLVINKANSENYKAQLSENVVIDKTHGNHCHKTENGAHKLFKHIKIFIAVVHLRVVAACGVHHYNAEKHQQHSYRR